jgi:hypothetical protein
MRFVMTLYHLGPRASAATVTGVRNDTRSTPQVGAGCDNIPALFPATSAPPPRPRLRHGNHRTRRANVYRYG